MDTFKNSGNKLDSSFSIEIEDLKEEKKNAIKRLKALQNLTQNPDFIYLIKEEFFIKEAANAVKIVDSDNAYRNEKLKLMNDAKIIAISGLQRWFNNIIIAGQNAPSELEELEKIEAEEESN